MENLIGNAPFPVAAGKVLDDEELLLVSAKELHTFANAERDQHWR